MIAVVMDKRKQKVKVLQGEASESDEELTSGIDNEFHEPQLTSQIKDKEDVKVVSGEASESDSDEDVQKQKKIENGSNDTSIEINAVLTTEAMSTQQSSTPSRPKYNSLLQLKLRERNQQLRTHLKKIFSDVYSVAKKEVDVITQQLCKSHVTIQETSHSMKLVTSDLEPLQEKLDIIVNCSILPYINI